MKGVTASQVAKCAAIATLVLAGLYAALGFELERYHAEDDSPSVMLFVFIGVGVLALVAPVIAIVAVIVSRQDHRLAMRSSGPSDRAAVAIHAPPGPGR